MKRYLTPKSVLWSLITILSLFSCQSSEIQNKNSEVENRKDSGLIEINDSQLFVKSIGEGEPIIVLHGGPGMEHGYFLPHLEMLADKYQLIFYDQRACGRSSFEVDSTSMSMTGFVADIEGIRNHFGLEKINLMGHSWGGLLAMWYAINHQENLNSLILVNSIGASREFTAAAMETMNARSTREDRMALDALTKTKEFMAGDSLAILNVFKLSFITTFYDRANLDKLNLSLPSDRMARQRKLQLLFPDLTDYDLHEGLSTVQTPTLIIHGDYDANPLDAMRKVEEYLPQSELVVIPECGHWSFIEKPEAFEEAVERFLSK